jgi:hypothetical protein
MASQIQGLSPKAKEILQRNAELRQRDYKNYQDRARREESIAIQSRENRTG